MKHHFRTAALLMLLLSALTLTLLSFPKPAECYYCGTAPCQTNLECFAGCACAIPQDRTFGTCVDVP